MAADFMKVDTLKRNMRFQAEVWSYSFTRRHPITVEIATCNWFLKAKLMMILKISIVHCPIMTQNGELFLSLDSF